MTEWLQDHRSFFDTEQLFPIGKFVVVGVIAACIIGATAGVTIIPAGMVAMGLLRSDDWCRDNDFADFLHFEFFFRVIGGLLLMLCIVGGFALLIVCFSTTL